MVTKHFHNWKIDVDIDATRQLYPNNCVEDSNACGCDECSNFAAQKLTIFPNDFYQFLRDIGINPGCETSIGCYGEMQSGQFLYQGDYEFVGQVLEKPSNLENDDRVELLPGLTIGISHTPSQNHYPAASIEFFIEIPWVIEAHKNRE
ncbi:MAG: hypothetical protein AAF959_28735 [Cyanobacteria bacterium P01_D01_bin.56]